MISKVLEFLSAPFRKALDAPLKLLSAPRHLWGMPLPVRVALAAFVVCLGLSVATYLRFLRGQESAEQWPIYALLLLDVVVPISVYVSIRQWLEVEISEYDEIDSAWRAGLEALAEERLSLEEVPIFLVLGVPNAAEAENLMTASGLHLTVKCIPEKNPALCWFAGPDAAFIVCTRASQVSRLFEVAAKRSSDHRHVAAPASFTIAPGRQTDTLGTMGPASEDDSSVIEAPPRHFGGTLMGAGTFGVPTMAPGAQKRTLATAAPPPAIRLDADEAKNATQWLEQLCALIRKKRQPYCPINGILTVLSFPFLSRTEANAVGLTAAVRNDLDCIRETLRLRCQVVALIGGMDQEDGFMELMRRLGRDRAKTQRFGKGYDPWSPPTPEQLEAVAKNACGAFETFIYHLFAEPEGHEPLGNTKLYKLLCKIRSKVTEPVTKVLAEGFGREPNPDDPPLLFSGCYFAATGHVEDTQAFVSNVFERLLYGRKGTPDDPNVEDGQNAVEWTQSAIQENNWYLNLANLCYCISGLLFLVICGVIYQLTAK